MASDPDITNQSGWRRIPSVQRVEVRTAKGSNADRADWLLAVGPSYSGGCGEGRRRFGRSGARSASSIQAGAWSLAFSQPRTSRSTPAAFRRAAIAGLEQQVVDAQAGVARVGVPEIVPERVDPLAGMQRAQRVGPALRDKPAKGFAHLGAEQRVVDPALRLVDVELGRHDVVVAGEHDRRAGREQLGGVRDQPLEPAQLVSRISGPGAGLPFGR